MIRVIRCDRGASIDMRSGRILEGVAGRVHAHGDGLQYPDQVEYRDQSEVASIAAQLARGGVPFTLGHPSGRAARDPNVAIIGEVIGGELRGDHAVAIIRVDDSRAIDAGTRELSLGYACELDAGNYQRSIQIDHLALVPSARCGATCSLRSDQKGNSMSDCNCKAPADLEAHARARSLARLSKHDQVPEAGSFFANSSLTSGGGGNPTEDLKAAAGGKDVPAELAAALRMQARMIAARIPDPADRAAAIAAHVANGLAKLAGGR